MNHNLLMLSQRIIGPDIFAVILSLFKTSIFPLLFAIVSTAPLRPQASNLPGGGFWLNSAHESSRDHTSASYCQHSGWSAVDVIFTMLGFSPSHRVVVPCRILFITSVPSSFFACATILNLVSCNMLSMITFR